MLEELLQKYILLVFKVNPSGDLSSTNTIHRVIYMECATNEILNRYLKFNVSIFEPKSRRAELN